MSNITPAAVKEFIADCKKSPRAAWLAQAERSWQEIRRTSKSAKDISLNSTAAKTAKRKTKYPAWWSIFKIRQPIYLSRIGIPIGRDTTQDGNDNLGACAAILKERLATNLAKSFDFFDVMCSVRDDGLATNIGFARAYYEAEDVKEEVKIRLMQSQDAEGNPVLIDPDGQIVNSPEVGQDEEGFFLETEEIVDVKEEKICLEHSLYKTIYIDPTIKRWAKCKQLAIEQTYTEEEFKYLFGARAFFRLDKGDDNSDNKGKKQLYVVYEYWDLYEKEVVWVPKDSDDLVFPKGYAPDEEGEEKLNGLYDLKGFFPFVKPFVMNQSTESFWPDTEYGQVRDILEDIHNIFSRMMDLTKAIRPRLLFDDNVQGLKAALNELAEAGAIGVTNLTQSLVNSGGSIEGVVQYVPVEKMIQGLEQMYQALEQRLNTLYKTTGTSDLLQGFVTDPTQRTFGERQMQEKYALNQSAEGQRKMAEFVRDSYELMCEMAIKNFKDESLSKYIIPKTLQPEHQALYPQALQLLKDENERFRVELETDSTIALNEEMDKQLRMQLVDTLTNALEKTANIAQSSPALIVPELHLLKYLIQGFRQGKLFQSEVTKAIDQLLEQAKNQPPAFNRDEANDKIKQQEMMIKQQELQIKVQELGQKGQEIQGHLKLEEYRILSDERFQTAKMNLDSQLAGLKNQIDQFKLQMEQTKNVGEAQLSYAELNANVSRMQQELLLKRDELTIEMQKIVDKKEVDQFTLMMEQQLKPHEQQLEQYKLQIDEAELQLRHQDQLLKAQEAAMTDAHVRVDNQLQEMRLRLDAQTLAHEMQKPQELPPITINMPQPMTKKKRVKITRDAEGNIQSLDSQDEEGDS